MKQYRFLLKPIFFIFNLLFATWLVITIEKIQPSDFGKHKKFFEKGDLPRKVSMADKPYLMDLFKQYKQGTLDSTALVRHVDAFLKPVVEKTSNK